MVRRVPSLRRPRASSLAKLRRSRHHKQRLHAEYAAQGSRLRDDFRAHEAAYRELEAFAQLGTELEPATQRQLDRGARMVELLKQPQYVPMDVVDQIRRVETGAMDVPVKDVLIRSVRRVTK